MLQYKNSFPSHIYLAGEKVESLYWRSLQKHFVRRVILCLQLLLNIYLNHDNSCSCFTRHNLNKILLHDLNFHSSFKKFIVKYSWKLSSHFKHFLLNHYLKRKALNKIIWPPESLIYISKHVAIQILFLSHMGWKLSPSKF